MNILRKFGVVAMSVILSAQTSYADCDTDVLEDEIVTEGSGLSIEDHMGTVYCGAAITAADLDFMYYNTLGNDSETHYWYASAVHVNAATYYATVKCCYEDNLFTDYDTCQITELSSQGVCCYAVAYDGYNSPAFTDLAYGYFTSSKASKVHSSGRWASFRVVFGQWIP